MISTSNSNSLSCKRFNDYKNAKDKVNTERLNCRICSIFNKNDYWNCDNDVCHELTSDMYNKYDLFRNLLIQEIKQYKK